MGTNAGRTPTFLLGDAHPLFRSGMRYLLHDAFAPVEVIDAGSRADVLALLEREQFDLVLTSLFSGEGNCERFLDELVQRARAGRLIILSSTDDPGLICRTLAAGAAGYLPKETPPEISLQAIRLVLAGGVYVPPAALRAGLNGAAPDSGGASMHSDTPLTERQYAVLELLGQGISNKGIARTLGVSPGTVKAHVANLLRLYGVENRTKLVQAAYVRGAAPASKPSERVARD